MNGDVAVFKNTFVRNLSQFKTDYSLSLAQILTQSLSFICNRYKDKLNGFHWVFNSGRIGIGDVGFRGLEKNPRREARTGNKLNPHRAHRTRVTLEGGERCYHCTISAHQDQERSSNSRLPASLCILTRVISPSLRNARIKRTSMSV